MALSGCPPQSGPGLVETEEKVEEARDHVETVERMKEDYYSDFMEAQSELENAEDKLEKRKIPDAYMSATKSLEASKRILKKFYLDTVTKAVETVKAEIKETTENDPDNPLKDFLPQLDEMLEYAERIQSGQEEVSLVKIRDYTEQTAHIVDSKQKFVEEKIESDISFDLGKYDLSETGKAALQRIVNKIIASKEENLSQYSDKTVNIKITVIGHTDEVGFREGTKLVKALINGFEDLVPQSGVDRRRFLNQRLSALRAKTIGDYFKEHILQTGEDNPRILIELDIVGKGEDLPPDVLPPHPTSDPRRRICKIYSYVIAR
jgi:outer membrane protein OmpA-like peptidoglycan-associated protein